MIKEKIKEDKEHGLQKVTISYVSSVLKEVTSELTLLDIKKQELFKACLNEIDIDFVFSGRKKTKNTAKKMTKAELKAFAKAHGLNFSDNNFDKKDDKNAMGSDSDVK